MRKGITEVNGEKCKGCELCVSVCPRHLISLSPDLVNSKGYHPAFLESSEDCVACANCAMMCPDGAISIFLREEGE